jgi:hypothetical protein
MTALTAAQRKALPESAFALPGRRFPIHDDLHAREALARVANCTPAEQLAVRRAVHKRYPAMSMAEREPAREMKAEGGKASAEAAESKAKQKREGGR